MRATATAPHSKKQINRAGKLWAKLLQAYRDDGKEALEHFDTGEVLRADELIDWWRAQHARPLANVNANLRYYIAQLPDTGSVTQRLKRRATIVDKLCREPTMALTTMEDIGGCRVITKDQAQAYRLRSRLKKNWDIHRDRDYVTTPKPSGYRALHLIVRRKSRLIEVQVRTPLQDFWANQVEADSRRLRTDFKSGKGEQMVHAYYVAVSELIALREGGKEADAELVTRLNSTHEQAQPYLSQPHSAQRRRVRRSQESP